MTRPWWDNPRETPALTSGTPVLVPGGRKAAIAALQNRIAGFVPEWRDLSEDDAGVALVRLFGLQLEAILARVERLPEKAMVEFLRVAGVSLAPARSASAILVLTPDVTNETPISVPPGARFLSSRSDDEAGDVTWETDASLSVPNLTLAEIHVFDGETAFQVTEGEAFFPLSARPEVGAALYLGFTGAADIAGEFSLAFDPAPDGTPKPVAFGGMQPVGQPAVQLRWEVLTNRGFQQVDVLKDDTSNMTRTGIITLALPRSAVQDRPNILPDGDPIYWLRLRLAGGQILTAPRLLAIHPHAVTTTAKQTFRDEFPVPETSGDTKFVRLSQRPVLAGSVVLEIDEGISGPDLFDLEDTEPVDTTGTFRRWSEVPTLAGQPADARVFTLEPDTGIIRFGDGREGRNPPGGIRGIALRAYATTLGRAGNVANDEITRMPVRLPGISEVTNPWIASGGSNPTAVDDAIQSGPATLKARGRAVSTGDMALLARLTEGANILKAYALSGVDPAFPSAERPGTLGVFVMPRRHPSEPADLPPFASSTTLTAVARHLAEAVGPLGARIVAASPRYENIRVEATISIAAGANAAASESAVRRALDIWLNPETSAWQIGATLRHADLTHVIMNADSKVAAVPFVALSIDGIAHPACSDVALKRFSLPWPVRHQIIVEIEEAVA